MSRPIRRLKPTVTRPTPAGRPARTMPAAFLTGLRRVEVREVPVRTPGPGEVLVELTAVGICGSDLHYWRWGRIADQIVHFPQTLGHEPAGIIAAVGQGVTSRREGQHVAVEPGILCGKCRECLMGRGNLCPHVVFLGMPGLQGAFQRYLLMPAANTEPLPEGMSDALGAASEVAGIALQTFDLVNLRPGERVAIIGGGPVGLAVAAAAIRQGATVVALSDPHPRRREVARVLGVERAVEPDVLVSVSGEQTKLPRGGFAAAVAEGTASVGADVVAECAGAPDGLEVAVQVAARGGRVAIVGIPEVDSIAVNPHEWRRRELFVTNVRRSNRALPRALRMLAGDGLGLERAGFFSGPVGLEGMQEALEDLDAPGTRNVKVIVDPRI